MRNGGIEEGTVRTASVRKVGNVMIVRLLLVREEIRPESIGSSQKNFTLAASGASTTLDQIISSRLSSWWTKSASCVARCSLICMKDEIKIQRQRKQRDNQPLLSVLCRLCASLFYLCELIQVYHADSSISPRDSSCGPHALLYLVHERIALTQEDQVGTGPGEQRGHLGAGRHDLHKGSY